MSTRKALLLVSFIAYLVKRAIADLSLAEPNLSSAAPLRRFWDWALKDANFAQLRLMYNCKFSPRTTIKPTENI